MPALNRFLIGLALPLFAAAWFAPPAQAELSDAEQAAIEAIQTELKAAGNSYREQAFERCGQQIVAAIDQIEAALAGGNEEVYEALAPQFGRIARAHALLELEGVRLPPFIRPSLPSAMRDTPATPQPAATPKPKPAPNPGARNLISFTEKVAPILITHCKGCHIDSAKAGFSLASFAGLMKGSRAGVVVFPGDLIGSRLIETIETGDMPRGGGRVPPPQLQILKDWVSQGAKFDGPSPAAPLVRYAPAAPNRTAATPADDEPLEMTRPSGTETVSFAQDVAPLLVDNCNGCHLDAMQVRGGLRMDTFAQLLRGGDSGAILRPGDGPNSLLVQKLRGEVGNIMPAGGRPPLAEASIQLISTWIDEGATMDGVGEDQPLRTMAALAWARNASHEELATRRQENAEKNWQLGATAAARGQAAQVETDNFFVIGNSGAATIEMVADAAENALQDVQTIVEGSSQAQFIKGRITLFVFPKRYEYGEFAKMVERRSLPPTWTEHWQYDVIDAYVPIVVSPDDSASAVETRLLAPLTSLAVASRGAGSPRWLAEGLGRAASAKLGGRNNEDAQRWREKLPEAVAAITKPDDFLEGRLTPERADLIAFGLGTQMLKQFRRQTDRLLANLEAGQPFETAFGNAYQATPQEFVEAWQRFQGVAPTARRNR